MQIFLRILKETAIAIVALALVAFLVWVLFQEQLPFLGKSVPDPINYAEINPSDFNIEGSIEDEINPTQTYEVTQEQSKGFEVDKYISTGAINPFTSQSVEPDVPTERVTIENSANAGNSNKTNNTDNVVNGSDNSVETDDTGTKSLE